MPQQAAYNQQPKATPKSFFGVAQPTILKPGQALPPKPPERKNIESKPAQAADAKPKEAIEAVPLTGPALNVAKLSERLTDVIREETKMLKEKRPSEAQHLHGEKNRLIIEYKDALGQLKMQNHILGGKESKERKYLRSLTDKLRDNLRDNARIVLRLKAIAEGVVKSVGEEVAKRDRPVMGYGARPANASLAARPTSLSLNQII